MYNLKRLYLFILFGCFLSSCTLATKRDQSPEAANEVSVSEDQKALNELRQNIPEEKRKTNDELKAVLSLFENQTQTPSQIRERYYSIVSRKRDKNRKSSQKMRDDFNKAERKARTEFMDNLKKERDKFFDKKPSMDSKREFTNEQDTQRRRFFEEQKDKRKEFESDNTEKNKNFEAEMKLQTDDFNQKLREYDIKFRERKQADRIKDDQVRASRGRGHTPKGGATSQGVSPEEFDDMKGVPGTPLAPDDGN